MTNKVTILPLSLGLHFEIRKSGRTDRPNRYLVVVETINGVRELESRNAPLNTVIGQAHAVWKYRAMDTAIPSTALHAMYAYTAEVVREQHFNASQLDCLCKWHVAQLVRYNTWGEQVKYDYRGLLLASGVTLTISKDRGTYQVRINVHYEGKRKVFGVTKMTLANALVQVGDYCEKIECGYTLDTILDLPWTYDNISKYFDCCIDADAGLPWSLLDEWLAANFPFEHSMRTARQRRALKMAEEFKYTPNLQEGLRKHYIASMVATS